MSTTEQLVVMHSESKRSKPGAPNPARLAEARARGKAAALWQLMEHVLAGLAWNG